MSDTVVFCPACITLRNAKAQGLLFLFLMMGTKLLFLTKIAFSALYKGLGVSMFGLVHVAIQFPLYENFKVQLADGDGHLSLSGLVVATATSKVVAGAISYPHEVIRSRQQHSTKPLRAIDAARAVYRHSGWQGFYHGLGTNLLRVMPSCVITFVTYEFVASLLTDLLEGSKLA
jgi:solute carrier family 25 folate transporter 32